MYDRAPRDAWMITGRGRLARGLHDRLDLLHVVDVEGPDAVAAAGGFVEELAHRDERHVRVLPVRGCRLASVLGAARKGGRKRDDGGTIREMFLLLT